MKNRSRFEYIPFCLLLSIAADALLLPSGQNAVKSLQSTKHSLIGLRQRHAKLLVLQSEQSSENDDKESLEYLKKELTAYLEKRKEANADEAAKEVIGTVVGGTKGNAVLDFVSGSPNKPIVVEEAPNVFDYDELSKYGYGDLVTPIMNAGGRLAMYKLMDMDEPALPERMKPKSAPKLVIDTTGETDRARYSGLKMGQVLDDDAMAQALAAANEKAKAGKRLRPELEEEKYVQPFADKRNTGPKQTPDWTPERLDEYAKSQGRAQAWARRAKLGEFVKDPFESLDLPLSIRFYSILSFAIVAFAFGRSTPKFLSQQIGLDDPATFINVAQVPALAVILTSLGSFLVCGILFAPSKNRSAFVWALKGLFGGPVAISQLRGLDDLITLEEQERTE